MERNELRSKIEKLLSTSFTTEAEIDNIVGEINTLVHEECGSAATIDIRDELIEISYRNSYLSTTNAPKEDSARKQKEEQIERLLDYIEYVVFGKKEEKEEEIPVELPSEEDTNSDLFLPPTSDEEKSEEENIEEPVEETAEAIVEEPEESQEVSKEEENVDEKKLVESIVSELDRLQKERAASREDEESDFATSEDEEEFSKIPVREDFDNNISSDEFVKKPADEEDTKIDVREDYDKKSLDDELTESYSEEEDLSSIPIEEDADIANKATNIRDICRRLESVYTKIQENNDKIQRLRRQIAELSAANAGLENKATDLLGKLPR